MDRRDALRPRPPGTDVQIEAYPRWVRLNEFLAPMPRDIETRSPEVLTFGCRLNAAESETMRRHAETAGLRDAVFVNTCAVTSEAVRQATQQIRRVRREQPTARIVVSGCAAQIEPDRFARLAEVDHVIGNAEKSQADTYRLLASDAAPRVLVGDIMTERRLPGAVDAKPSIPRAFVEIQNGCDHNCTFCVIPFGRGRSRSVTPDDVVARVRSLIDKGLREIVLTGVDVTSWGRDLGPEQSFGGLVKRLLREVEGLERLRLSSIDQAETDPDLLAAFAEEERLMPHLHLSLQSGSDLILKRMKRRHSRADAIGFAAEVRRLRPDIALGADLIAGFPTETEPHFNDTLSLVDECGLAFLHVFPYSPRPGTAAARMPQVDSAIVRERAARLREKERKVLNRWLDRRVGERVMAALERDAANDGSFTPARSPQFEQMAVACVRPGMAAGTTLAVQVSGHDGRRLQAEVCG